MNTTTLSVELIGSTSMSGGRLLGAYLAEAKYECIRALRTPAFAIPFLLLPIALYVLFGILLAGSMSHGDPTLARIMFVNWSVFGVMGPGMFGFGMIVAQERDHGLLTLKRALPMPPAAYLLAKMFMTMTFAAIIMVTLIVAALTFGHVRLGLGQILTVSLLDILGSLPFCAVGFFIGTRASSRSAPAFINLAYLPMMHLEVCSIPCRNLFSRLSSYRRRSFWTSWDFGWPTFRVSINCRAVRQVLRVMGPRSSMPGRLWE